jgi:tetratricopeptide (TPR) repeat protein
MTIKFSSREIHFLKTDSDGSYLKPPEIYFSDLLLTETAHVKAFEKRLDLADIPENGFLCTVFRSSPDAVRTIEKFFNEFSRPNRGLIFETLSPDSLVMACWDESGSENPDHLVKILKKKMSAALRADIMAGTAYYPFRNFTRKQTFANALKAIDHAAFFGPGSIICFDATSLNICGDRLYQLGKCSEAIREYRQGLEISPSDINLINSLGVCYGVMGQLEKAGKEFKKAMALNPDEPMVLYNTGLLHHIRGDIDKAVSYLHKAHAVNNSIFHIELLLGDLLKKKNKPDTAILHLDRAGELNPLSALVFRLKGEIYLEEKQFEKAGMEFNKAIKTNPNDALSLSGYAMALERQDKNLSIALSFARKSIDLDPDNHVFKKRLWAIEEKINGIGPEKSQMKTA